MSGMDWALQQEKALETLNLTDPDARVYSYDSAGGADFDDMNEALAACENSRGDTILVAPGTHSVDEIIDFNVIGVRVLAANMGMPPEAAGERFTICPSATYTDGPAAKITQPVHLRGLGFTTRYIQADDAESCGLQIDCEETGGFNGGFSLIEYCRFSCWYGAQAYGVYQIGGAWNVFRKCSWDGLFGGFANAGIGAANDEGGLAPTFLHIQDNYFSGLGSSKPALKFITGAVPVNFVMTGNYNQDGFGTRGVLLDNNSVVSGGIVGGNWTGLANKAAAFLNLTNSNLAFQDNHYNE
jgi:hypothetical protein